MSVKYVIEGGTITKVEEVSTAMVSLDGLLPGLTSYVPLELSPMPTGLKYIIIEPKEGLELRARLLVQVDPGYQRINYKDGRASNDIPSENYRLALPYGLFWFEIDGNRMVTPEGEQILWAPRSWGYMWMKEPYTGLDTTTVWPAYFPNCWENGRVCFGSTSVPSDQPLGNFVDHAINNFWTSEFNNDLERNWPYRSISEWEENSRNNPEVWREWDHVWDNGSAWGLREKLDSLRDRYDNRAPQVEWRDAVPSSSTGPIPGVRVTPTWYNLNEWLDNLSAEDYQRFVSVINEREHDER